MVVDSQDDQAQNRHDHISGKTEKRTNTVIRDRFRQHGSLNIYSHQTIIDSRVEAFKRFHDLKFDALTKVDGILVVCAQS
jgi:hypothetical protein